MLNKNINRKQFDENIKFWVLTYNYKKIAICGGFYGSFPIPMFRYFTLDFHLVVC